MASLRVFRENRDEVAVLNNPLMNKFSERAGERAQMRAERSTRNREYPTAISGCLSLVAVVQSTHLANCNDRPDFGPLNQARLRRVFFQG